MDNLNNILKQKGMTKVMLAERLGILKQNLNSLLKNPTLTTIKRIADALDVSPARLFVDDDTASQTDELTADVYYNNVSYHATDLAGLEAIVNAIKASKSER